MQFEKSNYSIREIRDAVEKQEFVFFPVLNSPEMNDEEFETVKNGIIDGLFPQEYHIYSIEYHQGRINFYHFSSLMSRIINFLRSSEFNNLEPAKKNMFYRYNFKIHYLIQYETETKALEYLDKLKEVKRC